MDLSPALLKQQALLLMGFQLSLLLNLLLLDALGMPCWDFFLERNGKFWLEDALKFQGGCFLKFQGGCFLKNPIKSRACCFKSAGLRSIARDLL